MIVRAYEDIKIPNFEVDGCRQYGMNYADVSTLISYLMTDTFIDNLSKLFVKPEEFISNIRAYPFEITQFYNSYERVGDNDIPIGGVVNTNVTGLKITGSKPTIILNSIRIPRKHNNFLDFSPYSTYELFLPYYGFIELDVDSSLYFDGRIIVYCTLDTYTGNLLYTITLFNTGSNLEEIVKTCETKVGMDIPIGSTNMNEMLKNFTIGAIATVIGGLGSFSSNSITAKAGSALMSTSTYNAIGSLKLSGKSVGVIDDKRNLLSLPNKVCLITKNPKVVEVTEYNKLKGRPLCKSVALNTLSGFTTISDVRLTNFGDATLTEIQEIEELLKSGVIL